MATPPGVPRRTPLARGEFCALESSSPLARGVSRCSDSESGRGVAKHIYI